ncbi:hypothetical protein CspeluHIS016_0405310 [Cutaneotrichosporon spelunceum]|uniref:Transmembrane protein n=1 Tax=Cutaneotrichosporon spelunceum TaxID=1672016 RepID=A0AAD3YD86_9TREE|nr:hypothetical protein CspeluHIS016_0405310 [Cutaneotrichosporon spelunceum]
MSPARLTNPQPPLALRFIISAAFAVCAFGVAPFVLIGLLLVAAGQPLMSAMRWWNAPRMPRKAATKAEREVPAPSPRRPRISPSGSYSSPAPATPVKPSEAQQIAAALRHTS